MLYCNGVWLFLVIYLVILKNDGILGMGFLTKHQCDIFLSKNHLLLNGEKINCFWSSVDAIPNCSRLAVTETVVVHPESEIIVEG